MSGALFTVVLLAASVVFIALWARRDASQRIVGTYSGDHRRFRTTGSKIALLLGFLLFISVPVGFSWIGIGDIHLPNELIPGLPMNERWLTAMVIAGIYAIGAIGLNLLIGNTGQISLGHSAFICLGAYSTGYFGVDLFDGKVPAWIWLIVAAVLGALVSAAIGPFALRLRGNYLAMVSLFLVFLAEHMSKNWDSLTGGEVAPRTDLPGVSFTPFPGKTIDFRTGDTGETDFFSGSYFFNAKQGYFWLVWGIMVIVVIVIRNLLRSRHGRAMMAVRDRDLSAEVIGVEQRYTKMWAFAVSGACASLAGALFGSFYGIVNPVSFNLGFSINFVAMIIIGGVGSILGSILGALTYVIVFDGVRWVFENSTTLFEKVPGLRTNPSSPRGFGASEITDLAFGVVIILFLRFFPLGVFGSWQRLRKFLKSFPFNS